MPSDLMNENDYINKDSVNKSNPTLGPYKVTEILPSTNRGGQADLNVKDMMTKYLERIKSKDLTKKEEHFQLS
jgi:hypothetical protein